MNLHEYRKVHHIIIIIIIKKKKIFICLVYVEKRIVIQSRVKFYPIRSNVNPTVTVTFTFTRVLDLKMVDNCMLVLAPLLHK